MVIRLNALQIAKFWDVIKFALQQTNRVGVEETQEHFNVIFAALMSDRAQCFLKYDSETIAGIMVCETLENKVTKKKGLSILCLYAYKPLDSNIWQENFDMIKKIAKGEGCDKISFKTTHPRVVEIGKMVGFKTQHTVMSYSLGG